MGRLQRYLRRLTAEEWGELHADAQAELRGKSLTLMERLRGTGIPQTLTPSEKELAKRIERWIWKRAFIERHRMHPHYRPHPLEWQHTGAELYHAKGLTHEAYLLLKAPSGQTLHELQFLLTRLRWCLSDGKTREAYRTVQYIWQLSERIRRFAERTRLQLILSRLLQEYGGSYTEIGRRFLRRLDRLGRWTEPLPADPEDLIAEANLRVLYHLARGRPDEAYLFCESTHIPPHAGLYLNQWTCSLLLRHPFSTHLRYPPLFPSGLTDYERAILLNRLLLSLLIYAPPSYIEAKLPRLKHWYVQVVRIPENHYTWAQILWLGGHTAEALQELERLLPRLQDRPYSYLRGGILLLLIYIEERNWVRVVRHTRHLLYWLRRQRRIIAAAGVLVRILYRLYEARLRPRTLVQAAKTWKAHLAGHPAEKYFWDITLLPDWIEAQLSQCSLRVYRQREHRAAFCDLEMLMHHAQAHLG